MSSINLYPKIDDIFLETVKINNKREYYYIGSDGNKHFLAERTIKGFEDKNIFELEDDNSEFDQTSDSLNMIFELEIFNGRYLFGKYGYVFSDAIIGVGIEWKSKKSKIRHCKYLGSFSLNDSKNKLVFKSEDLVLNELNSDTSFSWVLFIEKAGSDVINNYYANRDGLVIGKKNMWTIKGEGIGSLFPIEERFCNDEPLWFVEVSDFDDPYTNEFSTDWLKICINKSHPDYQCIQLNNKNFNQQFLKEVLSSSLYLLITETKKRIDNFDHIRSQHYESGSIVQALLYFDNIKIKVFENDIELFKSIKKYFDNNNL